jgi:type VI protein secretion system component Hcp
MQYELDRPQEYPVPFDLTAAANTSTPVLIVPFNGNSPSQTGLLLMYTDGKAGQEASFVTVTP